MRSLVLLGVLTTLGLLATGGRAFAAASCSITAATMPFGSYDVYGAALAVSGSISMTCVTGGNPAPHATLSSGSGTIADRYMTCSSGACLTGFSTDQLHYNLYTTVAHAAIWGATGVASTPANCKNRSCAWTIFGLVPAAIGGGTNDVSVGGYADAITVTVTY
ncbi:MAG TPA: spore coat protein U domain-containing protein [Candidatus Baltobacteraceae bacterium]|jgi:spore coat protein U-like protein